MYMYVAKIYHQVLFEQQILSSYTRDPPTQQLIRAYTTTNSWPYSVTLN